MTARPLLIKRYLPKGLFLRSLIILVAPIVLVYLIAGTVFFERHWGYVSQLLSENIVNCLNEAIDSRNKRPFSEIQKTMKNYFDIHLSKDLVLPLCQKPDDVSTRILDLILAESFPGRYAFYRKHKWLSIWIDLGPQGIWKFELLSKRLAHRTTLLFVLWAVGSSCLFLIVAAIMMRNQIRPLRRLATWSDDLQHTLMQGKPNLIRIEGAREIRKIAFGIRTVVEQIHQNFEERNQMLMGISHDLRTPLARMKLQLQFLPSSTDRDELCQDLDQMIAMVQSYLSVARQNVEELTQSDMQETFQNFHKNLKNPKITVKGQFQRPCDVMISRVDFGRCLQNLIDNALRYCKTKVVLSASLCPHTRNYVFCIDDDGPGIDPQYHDQIFRPFFRIEPERPLIHGQNIGLGLYIVQRIIWAHSGKINVGSSPLGGARLTVVFKNCTHRSKNSYR